MGNADLRELLGRHGVREDWNSLTAQASKYNEPFSRIAPVDAATMQARGAALYAPATHDLRKLARRTQERYTTVEAIDGDINAILVRVCELDDVTCNGCDSLAGFEGNIAQHEEVGLPGEAECGGNCRCQLVRVEGGGASPAGNIAVAVAAAAAVTALTEDDEPDEEIEEVE